MPKPRHLKRAPIVEAVVDIRARLPQSFEPTWLNPLADRLKSVFPTSAVQHKGRVTLNLAAGAKPPAMEDLGTSGIVLHSADRLLAAQLHLDGIALHRLSPYTSWTAIQPCALQVWNEYVSVANPEAVTRLGLRYINRIELPSPPGPLDQYLTSPPTAPPDFPPIITAFFNRITTTDPKRGCSAHITHAIDTSPASGLPILYVDIDVFRQGEWTPRSNEIEAMLEQLHGFKNELFFSLLTETLIARYE
jgi:uncharacterized protein (TIGR04255 family)